MNDILLKLETAAAKRNITLQLQQIQSRGLIFKYDKKRI